MPAIARMFHVKHSARSARWLSPPAAERSSPSTVSRETSQRLDVLVDELWRWQTIKNLVGPGTLAEVWTRHIADSLQLLAIEPQARRWVDLGSGAGFPGLVLAIALAERAGAHVHLVESNARKCAFLRDVARLAGAPATIHEARIEAVAPGSPGRSRSSRRGRWRRLPSCSPGPNRC